MNAPTTITATATAAVRRGSRARVVIWAFHLALPLAGLWLLLAVPPADVVWEHHPSHFWLVAVAAALSAWLALTVDRAARHHGDARLLLVGLGFLAAALFFGLHALATPGVLLDHANGGFALATPAGLALSAVFGAAAALNMDGGVGRWALRADPYLRYGLIGVAALWGVVSLTGLPPLADPGVGERGSVAVVVLVVLAVPLYLAAAVRCFLLYRQRRSVVLLSVLTADVLLAEAMVAVALGANWHLTWWLWHVLMVMAFGYVGYSAYVTYRREGATRGLFDAVGTEATLRAVRVEYGSALEQLVAAVARQEAGELTPAEMSLITSGLAVRFGLSEGQTAVLGRAAAALRADREQIGRLDVLVAIGHESGVLLGERDLLARAVRRVVTGFGCDAARIGLLDSGRLSFPAALASDPRLPVPPNLQQGLAQRGPFDIGPEQMACTLAVKERPAGVLVVHRRGGFGGRDRAMIASLAAQLSMGLENARLYEQLDGLFRQYMSPDVATALIADPRQAALGGAVVEVTAVFADLRGFTTFSEASTPEQIVAMLNRYFEVATAEILAAGGTIVQFVGDALMALFNAPVRQPDHAVRAAAAALRMQAGIDAVGEPDWPRFRVGINTGPALVGNIGSTELRNFNAMGDAVNVAARLETTALPGQVVIGESTRALLPSGTVTEPLGELAVKGRRTPVVAHILTGLPGVRISTGSQPVGRHGDDEETRAL
ncbi:MAG TPA: adenylate/guanylate cyclase domain-containing protein [Pseudonocardia sp.]|nr:adenylate/guanylate cyclase domain-containing protein [Pseudonocardia sp.]